MESRRNILLVAGAFGLGVLALAWGERESVAVASSETVDATVATRSPRVPASHEARARPGDGHEPLAPPPARDPGAQPRTLTDLMPRLGPGARVIIAPAPAADVELANVTTGVASEASERGEPASKTQCNVVDGSGGCADPLPGDHDRDGHPSATDRDDFMRDVHPGASELRCNGIDDDCQGGDLCLPDRDDDGDPEDLDCDDRNPLRNGRAVEVPCNRIDEDCSGADVCDGDGDGDPAPKTATTPTPSGTRTPKTSSAMGSIRTAAATTAATKTATATVTRASATATTAIPRSIRARRTPSAA